MITSNQKSQLKEPLNRVQIRTMKKDILRLREFDSLQEREKISKTKTVKEADLKQSLKLQENKPLIFISDKPEKILQSQELGQNTKKENSAKKNIKEHASETEKQQIFLLESQKLNLENQIKNQNKESESFLILEKNKILLEQKEWQKKLGDMVQEKQNLEEKGGTEEQIKNAEKKRWFIEGELVKLESRIKELDENNKKSQIAENNIKAEIAKIDESLNNICLNITEREKTEKKEPPEESLKGAQTNLIEKNTTQNQNQIITAETKEKEYLKEVPLAAREKLAKSAEIEEKHRKNFIEDVAKWAEEKKEDNNNINTQNE